MSSGIGLFVIGVSQIGVAPLPPVARSLGYEKITDLASIKGMTVPVGAVLAVVRAESVGVRYRDDGVDPSADDGMPLSEGETIQFYGSLEAIRFAQRASGAILDILYYGASPS